jgi:hypothetical protein
VSSKLVEVFCVFLDTFKHILQLVPLTYRAHSYLCMEMLHNWNATRSPHHSAFAATEAECT